MQYWSTPSRHPRKMSCSELWAVRMMTRTRSRRRLVRILSSTSHPLRPSSLRSRMRRSKRCSAKSWRASWPVPVSVTEQAVGSRAARMSLRIASSSSTTRIRGFSSMSSPDSYSPSAGRNSDLDLDVEDLDGPHEDEVEGHDVVEDPRIDEDQDPRNESDDSGQREVQSHLVLSQQERDPLHHPSSLGCADLEPHSSDPISGHSPAVGDEADEVQAAAGGLIEGGGLPFADEPGPWICDLHSHSLPEESEPDAHPRLGSGSSVLNAIRHQLAHQQRQVVERRSMDPGTQDLERSSGQGRGSHVSGQTDVNDVSHGPESRFSFHPRAGLTRSGNLYTFEGVSGRRSPSAHHSRGDTAARFCSRRGRETSGRRETA